MNIRQTILVMLAVSLGSACAQEVSRTDAGTYEWLKPTGEPSGVLFKLSMNSDGTWSAEGKLPGKDWQNISCDQDCGYRNSTASETISYFPKEWIAVANVACIQNRAQAFCKAVGKNDPTKEAHFILTLDIMVARHKAVARLQ